MTALEQLPIDVVDGYELVRHRVAVGLTAGRAAVAVRSVLRGFPRTAVTEALPRYDFVETSSEWEVRVDQSVVHRGSNLTTAVAELEWRIVTAALDRCTDRFHLHGAALCLPARRAGLVLVGQSGSGKTTLTLALMLRGFVPFCDDIMLLDPDTLDIHAVPRAFHIEPSTWELLEQMAGGRLALDPEMPVGYFCPPQTARHPVPVAYVLFPEYRAGRTPELQRLTPAEAAGLLMTQTASFTTNPRLALTTITRLTERAGCYRFVSSDLPASVSAIQQLVAAKHIRTQADLE
jgi:hypothetical protein